MTKADKLKALHRKWDKQLIQFEKVCGWIDKNAKNFKELEPTRKKHNVLYEQMKEKLKEIAREYNEVERS